MHWQFTPFTLSLALLGLMALLLARLAWRHRPARPALFISVLMLGVAGFAFAYMLELMSANPAAEIFWAKVEYLAFLTLPVIWLIFVLEYTGRKRLLTPRNIGLAMLVPAMAALVLWTNDYHRWFYRPVDPVAGGAAGLTPSAYGPFFWVIGAYTFVVAAVGCFLILRPLARTHRLYSMQILALLVGFMLPWIGSAVYSSGVQPLPGPRLAPFAFLLAALAVVWGLFHYRLIDIKPVARAALVDGMEDAVLVLDDEDRVVDLNAAVEKVLSRPASAMIGRPAGKVVDGWSALEQDLRRDGAEGRAELELSRNGKARTYDLRVSTLRGPLGDTTGRLCVLRDVTEHRAIERAEREQRALADALHEATASLVSTLEFTEVLDRMLIAVRGIVPYDCASVMLLEGDIARSVRARDSTDDADLAQSLADLSLSVSQTHNLRFMLHTGRPHVVRDTQAYALWTVMPGTEWVHSHVGVPLRIKGQVLGFLNLDSQTPGFYGPEHTERLRVFANQVAVALENARLFSSLEETNTQLQAALLAKDEMIQNVSHELRTPLTVVSGYLELLRGGEMGPLTPLQEDGLRVLHTESVRLKLMVERLLTLQSVERGKLHLELLELGAWLRDHAIIWKARAAVQEMGLCVEVPDGLPLVKADAGLLLQVFENLLDNALKFSPKGSEITVRAWASDGEVVVAVCDQGVGIPADKRERVFERFYQVDGTATRRYGGMGIGLALCRAIVEAHDGRIWVESAGEDCGSSLFVALKTEPEVEPAADAPLVRSTEFA